MHSTIDTLMGIFCLFFMMSSALAQENPNEMQALKEEVKTLQDKVSALETKKTESKPNAFNVFWKDGLWFETADKAFSFTVRGRILSDFGFVHEDDAIRSAFRSGTTPGAMDDYAEIIQGRIGVQGTLYDRIVFVNEFDFSGQVSFKDVYVGIQKLPFDGKLLVGHFKEPFSLEGYTGIRYISLMERPPVVTALYPGFNLGVGYFGHDESFRFTFGFGLFRETGEKPPKINEGGGYAFTARFTGLPWYENKGEQLFHLGLGYSYRNPAFDSVQYSALPESRGGLRSGKKLLDTGVMSGVEDVHLLGGEMAFVFGPFSLQSEIMFSWLRPEGSPTGPAGTKVLAEQEHFWGWYASASYFLTGEHRNYKTSNGSFDRVRPAHNLFSSDGGFGAIELAARYSMFDLNEDQIKGGRMDNVSVGINWYWNPNMRVMLNYVYSQIRRSSVLGDADLVDIHILMGRFQLDF